MSVSAPERKVGRARLILVVEDELFIALDLVATLEEQGYRVQGPASSVAKAFTLLGQWRPDAAVLDMNLRGEMVTPVARLLREMAVPFVLSSAYARDEMPVDEALAGAPYLSKPTDPDQLLRAVEEMLGTRS